MRSRELISMYLMKEMLKQIQHEDEVKNYLQLFQTSYIAATGASKMQD
jgi:hypothetical protein